jgi:hypothetical protein
MILIIGPGILATIVLSSLAGGTGNVVSGVFAHVITVAVSLLLNIGLFWLAFRIATAREIATRDLRLSAILAAVAWQILQVIGGYFVAHAIKTNSAYGVFGVVLGLLAWFYLEAQIALYVVELNVVRVRRLWPRSLNPPPLTDADLRSYALYAAAQQREKQIEIITRAVPGQDQHGASGTPGDKDTHRDKDQGQPVPKPRTGDGPPQRRSSLRQYATRATHRLRRG